MKTKAIDDPPTPPATQQEDANSELMVDSDSNDDQPSKQESNNQIEKGPNAIKKQKHGKTLFCFTLTISNTYIRRRQEKEDESIH
jgi:hypothetical protein